MLDEVIKICKSYLKKYNVRYWKMLGLSKLCYADDMEIMGERISRKCKYHKWAIKEDQYENTTTKLWFIIALGSI